MKLTVWMMSVALGISLSLPLWAQQRTYKTPQEAVNALRTALEARDDGPLVNLFGPQVTELLQSEPDRGSATRRILRQLLREQWSLAPTGDKARLLRLGAEGWPFPVPLVRSGGAWRFDLSQGKEEILNRRIGRLELLTLETCRCLMEAQADYFQLHKGEYASRFVSRTGQHDGLYWPADEDGPSPLQKALRDTFEFTRGRVQGDPWFGYHYRMLGGQPGQTKGYAWVCWPAQYGKTGVMTFLCSHEGKIFEKDLGPTTVEQVKVMDVFDPEGWAEVGSAAATGAVP